MSSSLPISNPYDFQNSSLICFIGNLFKFMCSSSLICIISTIVIMLSTTQSLYSQSEDNLIAHYKLDGNALDASVNQLNGYVIGKVLESEDRFGNPCGAMDFDGKSGYIEIANAKIFNNISDNFTICGWTNISAYSDNWWITICCKGNQSFENQASPHFRFQMTKLTVSWNTKNVPKWQCEYEKDTWYFWAITSDGKEIKIYKNGKKIESYFATDKLVANRESLEIGRDVPGYTEYFWGKMDDIRIYSRCLTRKEIIGLYDEQPIVECKSPEPVVLSNCYYPETTNNINIIDYRPDDFILDIPKLQVFASDTTDTRDAIQINYNGIWLVDTVFLSKSRTCIFETKLNDHCNYIIFKSAKGTARFNLIFEKTSLGTISCSEDYLYGIKLQIER